MKTEQQVTVKEITVHEVKSLFDNKVDFQLIDVREEYEHKVANIGGKLIPFEQIYFHLSEIDRDRKVVLYCRSGKRSAEAIRLIEEATGLENLFNLKGGIIEWSLEIDSTILVD